MTNDDVGDYQKQLNQAVDDGGGCTETWEVLEELRASIDNTKPRRRGVLKGLLGAVGLGVGSIVGFSGPAQGHTMKTKQDLKYARQASRPFQSREQIRSAVSTYGNDLVTELYEYDFVDSTKLSAFVPDHSLTKEELSTMTDGYYVAGVHTDTKHYAHIQINKQLSKNKQLTAVVMPQEERSYALVGEPRQLTGDESYPRVSDSSTTLIIDPAADIDEPITPDCQAAEICQPDAEEGGCPLDECDLIEFQCCNNYSECYTQYLGSCSGCCVPVYDCDSIWGDCTY